MRAGDSCLRRSLEGLFCKRNLKPSPQEDPRPTFSLWQTEAADRSPLGLPAHLLTVVVHPHGAAEKQWNLLLRERQNCSCIQSEGLFPQQVLSAMLCRLRQHSYQAGQQLTRFMTTLIYKNMVAAGLLFKVNNKKGRKEGGKSA